MRSEQCSYCQKWKVECDHCNGSGYFDVSSFGTPGCDHCDAQDIKCPDAWRKYQLPVTNTR